MHTSAVTLWKLYDNDFTVSGDGLNKMKNTTSPKFIQHYPTIKQSQIKGDVFSNIHCSKNCSVITQQCTEDKNAYFFILSYPQCYVLIIFFGKVSMLVNLEMKFQYFRELQAQSLHLESADQS